MEINVLLPYLLLLKLLFYVTVVLCDENKHHVISRRHIKTLETDADQWTHSTILDEDTGKVILRWQPRHQEILFRIVAKTIGYIAIGFSSSREMKKADIVVGWVDDYNLTPYLWDCHSSDSEGHMVTKDKSNNYVLMKGIQNKTHTLIEFKRALDTCDNEDYKLNSDTVNIIWMYHSNDVYYLVSNIFYQSEAKGSKSVYLMELPVNKRALSKSDNSIRTWEFLLSNVIIRNNMETIYMCKIFKTPTIQSKAHIIGYEPILGRQHKPFIHHMYLYECDSSMENGLNQTEWDRYSEENAQYCYGDNMPIAWEKCIATTIAWGIGSNGEMYPENVGIALNGDRNTYYMLEIHFDNPSLQTVKDTSGLKIHYTHKLRANEGATMVTGIAPSQLHFVPPFQAEFKTAGYCSMDCTSAAIPRSGIHFLSVMLHSHQAGKKMKLRHIRGKKEFPPIAEDNNYDWRFQQSRSLADTRIMLPGDYLITECTYNTQKRTKPIIGGYSTRQEMCLAYILYYPKTNISGCYSMSPVKYFFETLGVKEFYGSSMFELESSLLHIRDNGYPFPHLIAEAPLFVYNPGDEMSAEANKRAIIALQNAKDYTIMDGDHSRQEFSQTIFDKLVIKEPSEFRNTTFSKHLNNIPYNESLLTKKIEEYFYTGLHLTFCRSNENTLIIRENVERLPQFISYSENKTVAQCALNSPNRGKAHKFNRVFFCFVMYICFWV